MLSYTSSKIETSVKASLVPVVKKQTSNPSSFLPVGQKKIVIAPAFKSRVNFRPKRFAGTFCLPVPMQHVFRVRVGGARSKPKVPVILVNEENHLRKVGA